MENYTENGRNIDYMSRNDIIEYLGIEDNETLTDQEWYDILEQAETIEKVYHNKNIDDCLKADYKTYIQRNTDIIIGNTKDLTIFIKQ